MPYTVLFPLPFQALDSVGHRDLNKTLLLEGLMDFNKRPGKNNPALSQENISTRDSKLVATY